MAYTRDNRLSIANSGISNNLASICNASFAWGLQHPNLPFRGDRVYYNVIWSHTSASAKCHLVPSNGFNKLTGSTSD